MPNRNAISFIAAVWQILRFAAIGLLVLVVVSPALPSGLSLLALWPASTGLAVSAAYAVIALFPARYGDLRDLLILGKVLDVVPGFALAAVQAVAVYARRTPPLVALLPPLEESGQRVAVFLAYYGVAIVVLVDLVLLLLLLAWNPDRRVSAPSPSAGLPELSETVLEEE